MSEVGADLRRTIEASAPALLAIPESASARPLAPGKWSAKEVIGHLIDSASNNHQRFVRAQFQEDLIFAGYAQEDWVRVQRYQEAPWRDLVALWSGYNLHLARVMTAMPEAVRARPNLRHNLGEIAWGAFPKGEPATLEDFMKDYVEHLRHHLRQVLPG